MTRRLFAPVDAASVALFRIAYGATLVAWAVSWLASGWIGPALVQPPFHFTFWGFGWVRPWPGMGMWLHFGAIVALGVLVAAGLFYRVAIVLLVAAFTYAWLIEEALFQNHFYLLTLFGVLLAFIPAAGAFSLDALRHPARAIGTVPAWSLFLLRAQMTVVYLFAGVAKLNGDWIRGEPMRSMLEATLRFPLLGGRLSSHAAALALSWGGLVFDLAIVPLLLWRRTRVAAFVAAVAFHLLNAALWPIDVFPWFAIAATTLFLAPDWPRRFLPAGARHPAPPEPSPPARTATLALGAAYLAVQLLLPLRHLAYPGPVAWTEEGHLWAWRMMIRQKTGSTTFVVTDPARGTPTRENPLRYVAPWQARIMTGNPDMILQLAHHVADVYRARDGRRVEVRAIATASLHHRKEQPLVDPTVDLAAAPRDLRHARWIVPLREPFPG